MFDSQKVKKDIPTNQEIKGTGNSGSNPHGIREGLVGPPNSERLGEIIDAGSILVK